MTRKGCDGSARVEKEEETVIIRLLLLSNCAGHPSAEELPSNVKSRGATRATDKGSKPPRGLIIPSVRAMAEFYRSRQTRPQMI